MSTKQLIKTSLYLISLTMVMFWLVGCSTAQVDPPAVNYRYSQPTKLPADYPTKTLPNGDMWKEFRDDLQLPVDVNNPAVRAQIRWFQNNQGFLNRSIARGAPYLYYIYQQTKKYHLPAELALIPIGESGFNPVNKSNRSAVGMWQFLSGTATDYGLRINKYYDGRCDVTASTNAALKYFTYLYYYFDNDWLLAIAAYNTGEGNVQRAILRNRRVGKPTNFWALGVHHDTRAYVPKLLALSAIIKNPSHYGVHLVAINNAPYFEQVDAGQQITMSKAAKLINYDPNIIRNLNPAYLRSVTEPGGPHLLLIPKSKVELFKDKVSGSNSTASENTNEDTVKPAKTAAADSTATMTTPEPQTTTTQTQTKWVKHIVTRGETLNSIARKFGTSPNTLRKVNHLKTSALRPKQAIKVPVTITTTTQTPVSEPAVKNTSEPTNDNTVTTTDNSAADSVTTNESQQSSTSDTPTPTSKAKPKMSHYVVDNGDTVFSIAKRFNISAAKLRSLNGIHGNQIKVGQKLLVPSAKTSTTSSATKKSANKQRQPNKTYSSKTKTKATSKSSKTTKTASNSHSKHTSSTAKKS